MFCCLGMWMLMCGLSSVIGILIVGDEIYLGGGEWNEEARGVRMKEEERVRYEGCGYSCDGQNGRYSS